MNTEEAARVASLDTSFLINVFRSINSSVPGEGLVFLIVLNLSLLNGRGQYLGLTHLHLWTYDGDSSSVIITIEVDTFKQDGFKFQYHKDGISGFLNQN